MRKQGSITVEAACVMAVILFSLAALIGNAGRIHDETVSAMVLHEAVEKCCHEKNIEVYGCALQRLGSPYRKKEKKKQEEPMEKTGESR